MNQSDVMIENNIMLISMAFSILNQLSGVTRAAGSLPMSMWLFCISMTWKWKCYLLSCVWLFVTPWTVALQAALSMEFSQQEYWNG